MLKETVEEVIMSCGNDTRLKSKHPQRINAKKRNNREKYKEPVCLYRPPFSKTAANYKVSKL